MTYLCVCDYLGLNCKKKIKKKYQYHIVKFEFTGRVYVQNLQHATSNLRPECVELRKKNDLLVLMCALHIYQDRQKRPKTLHNHLLTTYMNILGLKTCDAIYIET